MSTPDGAYKAIENVFCHKEVVARPRGVVWIVFIREDMVAELYFDPRATLGHQEPQGKKRFELPVPKGVELNDIKKQVQAIVGSDGYNFHGVAISPGRIVMPNGEVWQDGAKVE